MWNVSANLILLEMKKKIYMYHRAVQNSNKFNFFILQEIILRMLRLIKRLKTAGVIGMEAKKTPGLYLLHKVQLHVSRDVSEVFWKAKAHTSDFICQL